MIYIIYPYRIIAPWFCEWHSKSQPKLFRHMCFGLAYKKHGEIHALYIHGKAIVYIEGANECAVYPKFRMYSSAKEWVKFALFG